MHLNITLFKGTQRLQDKRKLAPMYVDPYKIYAKRGDVAYALALPDSLSRIHNVFHVSHLKCCLKISTNKVDLREIEVDKNGSYKEHSIAILDFLK